MKKNEKRSIRKDERAVSPVIAVIMMIAIVVIIASVVAAFAYGIIGGVTKAPNAALVVDGAYKNSEKIIIVHHGGDAIVDAFGSATAGQLGDANWSTMEVRLNGLPYEEIALANSTTLNGANNFGADDFEPGDELVLNLTNSMDTEVRILESGDSISIVYVLTGDMLQRIKVS